MIGRLVHKADFERLLATRSRLRSAHFALHHVASGDLCAQPAETSPLPEKLSTALEGNLPQPVDDLPASLWIGAVVPKRHARRAVTRSLLKRQIRNAFDRHAGELAAGHWLVRLHAGFAAVPYVSAHSEALAAAARSELDSLLNRVHS
jgi:ribonuclease P protein component